MIDGACFFLCVLRVATRTARYVIFDTQMIVEKATLGDRDFAWHTMELFIDFVAIFVRICIILLRNSEESKGKSSRSRRSHSKSSATGSTFRR